LVEVETVLIRLPTSEGEDRRIRAVSAAIDAELFTRAWTEVVGQEVEKMKSQEMEGPIDQDFEPEEVKILLVDERSW
jgi:hypothetical protein